MLKEWVLPVVGVVAKFAGAVALLSCVWAASAQFHKNAFRADSDTQIRIRVKAECLRPEWVRTEQQAEKYDLTERELLLVEGQTKLVSRRLDDLLTKAKHLEALRHEMAQGRVPARAGGMGGPAPSKRSPSNR
jgi:hypothetical protein